MLSYIEISKDNLLHNLKVLKSFMKDEVEIAALIKANAYGHDQNLIAKLLEKEVEFFQVDDIEELRLVRRVTQKPVLVFGYVEKAELEEVVELGGILAIYDKERLLLLEEIGKRLNKKIPIHIKIDADLGRQGVLLKDLPEFAEEIANIENVEIQGIYSHFANIEDTSDFSHAQKQIDAYEKALKMFFEKGIIPKYAHMSASSGVMTFEYSEGASNLARPGISLYGLWPSKDLRERFEKSGFVLKPVMRWVTHIAQVKTVPANYTIGYGLTYKTEKETKIAVVPQGYSDGYDRGFSNNGEVLIGGKRCPVLGRVAMNMFVVDVSHLENIQAEDEVVLIGKQGGEEITVEELADRIGTINYEIVARISPLPKRVLV